MDTTMEQAIKYKHDETLLHMNVTSIMYWGNHGFVDTEKRWITLIVIPYHRQNANQGDAAIDDWYTFFCSG